MLKVEKLNVHFGDFHALKDVSLEIPDGEFFTLLGPSGCGKTTTLRAITGFIKPSSGKITINGKDITDIPVEKRNIGMVFQSYALFPTMTVYQNIAFSLQVQKKNKVEIDDIVHECARKVDLTDVELSPNCPAASSSVWPLPGHWPATRPFSAWTSLFPTWTPSCASSCVGS